jgi:hypothetical protein
MRIGQGFFFDITRVAIQILMALAEHNKGLYVWVRTLLQMNAMQRAEASHSGA